MSRTTNPRPDHRDRADRRIRRAWWIFAVVLHPRPDRRCCVTRTWPPIDWAVVGLIVIVGVAAIRHREAVAALEVARREEAESFARILSGLSRSVSPDAILGAIVNELGEATGADHIVIARRRPDARILEATLVSSRPGAPTRPRSFRSPTSRTRRPEPAVARREPIAIPVGAPVRGGGCGGGIRPDRRPDGSDRRSAARSRADPVAAAGRSRASSWPTGSRSAPARSTA